MPKPDSVRTPGSSKRFQCAENGSSGEHSAFPGTLSIGQDALRHALLELGRSADRFAGVVFVNGHGGNVAAVDAAMAVLEHEQRAVLTWWPSVAGGDPHAGHTETSLMLAIAPEQVRADRAVSGPVPSMAELVRHGVQPLSETHSPAASQHKDRRGNPGMRRGFLTRATIKKHNLM